METRQQKLKNRLKNTILLVLFVSMLALTFLTWLTGLSMESIPGDSMLARLYQRFTYGISGFEIRTGDAPAAEPTRIAVTAADGLIGAQYHTATVSVFYDALAGHMGAALAACDAFESCDAQEFARALHGDVLYFGYEGYLPISLLSDWLGRGVDSAEKTDLLLLTADGRLFIHTETGYRAAYTRAQGGMWQDSAAELAQNRCSFAEMDDLFAHVRPDTLLFMDENTSFGRLSVRQPGFLDAQSGSDLTALLDAFGYDPHVLSYAEKEGLTRVFVDNYSTLHVGADGVVTFRASAEEGGLESYVPGEIEQHEALRLQTNFAYQLVRAVQSSMSDNTQAMLFDVTDGKKGSRVLTFIQFAGGIPVEATPGQPFARLEFRENQMMAARFYLRALEDSGEYTLVLPGMQSAAAASAGRLRQVLVYVQDAEGSFTARRAYIE